MRIKYSLLIIVILFFIISAISSQVWAQVPVQQYPYGDQFNPPPPLQNQNPYNPYSNDQNIGGRTVVEGVVTGINNSTNPPTLEVMRGQERRTFRTIPETGIRATDIATGTTQPVSIREIYPGDYVTITTPGSSDVALDVQSRYRTLRGNVSRIGQDRVFLNNDQTVIMNPSARIMVNGQPSRLDSIYPGQDVLIRMNPVTYEGWWVDVNRPRYARPVVITSFTHNARYLVGPGDTVRFVMRGTSRGRAYYEIPGIARGQMYEVARGVYQGTFRVPPGIRRVSIYPIGILEVPGRYPVTARSSFPIAMARGGRIYSYDYAPVILYPRSGEAISSPFTVYGRTEPFSRVVVRARQAAAFGPIAANLETQERQVIADANGNFETNFSFAFTPSGTRYVIQAFEVNPQGDSSPVATVQVIQL